MTELVATPAPSTAIMATPTPSASEFDVLMRQAQLISQSNIVPASYRGKEANVLAAAMTGRTFGWDVMTAMRNIHVIEGTASLKPEAMLGLVRRAGHSVSGEMSAAGATVTGTRRDSGDTLTITWTVEDAKRAGLWGKRGPWTNYPASMFWARVVSQLCRSLFPDVVLGLGYTPEEVGAQNVDAEGEPVTIVATVVHEAPKVPEEFWARVGDACGDADTLRDLWAEARTGGFLTSEVKESITAAAKPPVVSEAAPTSAVVDGDPLESYDPTSSSADDVIDAEVVAA